MDSHNGMYSILVDLTRVLLFQVAGDCWSHLPNETLVVVAVSLVVVVAAAGGVTVAVATVVEWHGRIQPKFQEEEECNEETRWGGMQRGLVRVRLLGGC